jgi:antimicrobial peptide system SdpB family protein
MYFHASVGKYNTPEWHNGTAAYYWFNDPTFGSTGFIYSTLSYLFKNPYIMLLFSWGTLLGELLLFARLFTDKRKWIILAFIGGVFFHIGIVLMFGLVSFFFAMFGALVLYTLWLEDFPSVIKELKNSLFKRVKWIIKLGRVSE